MAKKKKATALAKFDAELAALAGEASTQEANTGGGTFFSIRGASLKLNDSPLPNNEMGCIIVDSVLENTYYEGEYDPENRSGPVCFAFGRSEDDITPHETVKSPQAPNCSECEFNDFGSAAKGKGKACKNRRRLAIISAGSFDRSGNFDLETDPKHYEDAEIYYLGVPPTSVKAYGAYVKKIAGSFKRPPFGVITLVRVVPDDRHQVKVTFEPVDLVSDKLIPAIMARHKAERDVIGFPYQTEESDAPAKGKKSKKKATKKVRTRR